MTTKAEKAEKGELLEIRLSLLKKELITDKDGNVVKDKDGNPLEKHVQHTTFEITDQSVCKAISVLLGDEITKEHMEGVAKDKDGEPILDAHKFELTGKKPEKKPAA